MYNQTLVNRVEVTDFYLQCRPPGYYSAAGQNPAMLLTFKGLVNENGITVTTPLHALYKRTIL